MRNRASWRAQLPKLVGACVPYIIIEEQEELWGWIREQDVPVRREGPWGRGGYRTILSECPWNGHADNSAYIVQHPGGAIAAGCHHASCQKNGWRELREHYEPGAYERRTDRGGVSTMKAPSPEPTRCPELAKEVLYGLPGEIVKIILPHSEAHLVALLINMLVVSATL